jgi:hypothetical protein
MSALGSPSSSLRRAALLEQLIVTLTTGAGLDGDKLPIKTRDASDLTIALLDAWATAGDVIGFYLDRITEEGYISSATEAGSILALASLLGHSPQLSVAAATSIAYQLQPDPTDTAIVLPAGLLCQSVPAAGQTAQTFQTTDPLTARPSWGLLTPKLTRPLLQGDLQVAQPSIVIAGTTSNLKPNQVVVVEFAAGSTPNASAHSVVSVTPDLAANTTTVELSPELLPTKSPAAVPAATTPTGGPPDVKGSVDSMLSTLQQTAAPPPSSANQLNRRLSEVFGTSADSTLRILSALQPTVGSLLYQAVATQPLSLAAVTGIAACEIQAVPFGAQAPPQLISAGPPAVTQPWPVDGASATLAIAIDANDWDNLISDDPPVRYPKAEVVVSEAGRTENAEEVVDLDSRSPVPPPQALGDGTVSLSLASVPAGNTLTVHYAGGPDSDSTQVTLTALIKPAGPVVLTLSPSLSYTWDLAVTKVNTTIGAHRLLIESNDQGVTITIITPLAINAANQNVLVLDSLYPRILAGSHVVVQRTFPDGKTASSVLKVLSVGTVTASAFGITAKATMLTLSGPWLVKPPAHPSQTTLQEITISGAATPLQPLPVAFVPPPAGNIEGQYIELSALIAGMEAGRLVAVTGQRADLLPAVVKGGELAMVAGLRTGALRDPSKPDSTIAGDTPTTTLMLQAPLAFKYLPSTVKIYGNVVPGVQGATITDVLGSGNPAVAFPSFTLSSGPLLSDPSPSGSGFVSTLTVMVDGLVYQEVPRLEPSAPPRSYVTGTDPTGKTTITFASPLPAGTNNVTASYRVGDGSQGNLAAGQLTTLLSRPAAAQSVTNPLPGTGGLGGAQPADIAAAAPIGVRGLGRLVSISDYADAALSWAGVAKATAQVARAARSEGVLVTVAGPDSVAIDPGIVLALEQTLQDGSDPTLGVEVVAASLYMIVLAATVTPASGADADMVADAVRAALGQAFAYSNRALAQQVALGDLIAAAHSVPSVDAFEVTALALVPSTTDATSLATALPTLLQAAPAQPGLTIAEGAADWSLAAGISPPAAGTPIPDGIAFISPAVPDTLLLKLGQ